MQKLTERGPAHTILVQDKKIQKKYETKNVMMKALDYFPYFQRVKPRKEAGMWAMTLEEKHIRFHTIIRAAFVCVFVCPLSPPRSFDGSSPNLVGVCRWTSELLARRVIFPSRTNKGSG